MLKWYINMTTAKSLRDIVYADFMEGADLYFQESGRILYQYDNDAGMVYYIIAYTEDDSFIYRVGDVIHSFLGYYHYEGAGTLTDSDIKDLIAGLVDAFFDILTLAVFYNDGTFRALDIKLTEQILGLLFDNHILFDYVKGRLNSINYDNKRWAGEF